MGEKDGRYETNRETESSVQRAIQKLAAAREILVSLTFFLNMGAGCIKEPSVRIFTIGYEGANILDFIETLDSLKVSRLIDVRDVPASRRRDFSKNILREHLEQAGISYSHYKALGDPKDGREAMRAGKREIFLRIFNDHIQKPEAQRALDEVVEIALDETCILLCYERDYKDCHRSIVANELRRRGEFTVQHIGVRKDAAKDRIAEYGAAIQSAY